MAFEFSIEPNLSPIDSFFFDSYALIEVVKGSENYSRFKDCILTTSKLNKFETYYILLRNSGKDLAEAFLQRYYYSITDFSQEIIQSAAEFKLENKNQRLSMADCIGYKIAESLGIKFLTGDEQFKNKPNVEFVK